METVEFDIRGQVCPSSLLLVLREVTRRSPDLAAGGLSIVILTDNRDATGTIPEAVANMGFRAEVQKSDGYYRVLIQRSDDED